MAGHGLKSMALDFAFYEQEQKDFGESLHKARGNLNNCDRLGLIVGTIRMAQYWHYFEPTGETLVRGAVPTYCIWPDDQRSPLEDFPLNPNQALKPRGRWQFDLEFTGHFALDTSFIEYLGLYLSRFNADAPGAYTSLSGEHEGQVPAGGWAGRLSEVSSGVFGAGTNDVLPSPFPVPNNYFFVPTVQIPESALPGVYSKRFTLSSSPEFCHPAFGPPQFHTAAGTPFDILFASGPTHYQPVSFLDAPVLSAGMPDVLIWEAVFTVKRIFDFAPRIVVTQTRYGTTGVDGGIYRATLSENGYNDGNGKVNWQWAFGDGGTGGPGGIVSHDYASAGPFTVTVIVTDSNGFTNTGTKAITLKRVNFTFANLGGGLWQFTNLSTDGDSIISDYLWQFTAIVPGSSTQTNPTFNFGATGSAQRFASLRVRWADGTSYTTPSINVV